MRTLLNESLPPNFDAELGFSEPKKSQQLPRIFSGKPVLATSEPILMEVGVGGTVIAASGASADPARSAPECGLAAPRAGAEPFKQSPTV